MNALEVLMNLTQGHANLLRELLNAPEETGEKAPPTEAVVTDMAGALTAWLLARPRKGAVVLGVDPEYPAPPFLLEGESWRDFYGEALSDEADEVDRLAGDFNRYAAAHGEAAAACYAAVLRRLEEAGIRAEIREKGPENP